MSAPTAPGSSFASAQAAGIHPVALPTPFLVGRVNCYLLKDEPLTLFDTGPNSGKSLDELERALAGHDLRIEDLELIVLTHQHMDHVGLLEILSRRSGAEVAALRPLAGYLEHFSASATADDEFAQDIMRRHGVPRDVSAVLGSLGAAFRAFGSSGHVTRVLSDGDCLEFSGRRLEVLHRPGHSPTDTVFWDRERGMLIGGDHLLAKISSNPLISRPLSAQEGGDRPPALIRYLESLRATRRLSLQLVLPGHGAAISDHVGLIDERLAMHRDRARKILAMLQNGPVTAYEIAVRTWGNVAVTQAYLTLSEVLGHLDLLTMEGSVREETDDGVSRFRTR